MNPWIGLSILLGVLGGMGCRSSGDTDTTETDTEDTDHPLGIDLGARFVVDLNSERGVTLPTVILTPDTEPSAAVVLLEGGDGIVALDNQVRTNCPAKIHLGVVDKACTGNGEGSRHTFISLFRIPSHD